MGRPFSCHCQLVAWSGRQMPVAVGARPGRCDSAAVGDATTRGPMVVTGWGANGESVGCAGPAHATAATRDTATATQTFRRVELIYQNLSQERVAVPAPATVGAHLNDLPVDRPF